MRPWTGVLAFLLLVLAAPGTALAQPDAARPDDVASPEAIILAAYAVIAREPGEAFDWDRFRSLFLPGARLVPNVEQTGGEFHVLTPDGFIAWADSLMDVDDPEDPGFQEEQVAVTIERYGDIAHAFSTYEKHFWGDEEVLGRGINSFQLVHNGGRWWIAGIVWDEETGAGPIPGEYLPEGETSSSETGSEGGDAGPDRSVESDSAAAAEAITEASRTFSRALERGDARTMAAQYTAGATLLPPSGKPVTGTEAITRFWTPRNPESRTVRHELTTEELDVVGEVAIDLGRWRQVARLGDQPETDRWGRYLVVWRRTAEGGWKMDFDAWTRPVEDGE